MASTWGTISSVRRLRSSSDFATGTFWNGGQMSGVVSPASGIMDPREISRRPSPGHCTESSSASPARPSTTSPQGSTSRWHSSSAAVAALREPQTSYRPDFGGLAVYCAFVGSDGLDVVGFVALAAGRDVEVDHLAFVEGLVAVTDDAGVMDEHVRLSLA
jgi:hypothetical protein